MRPTAPTPQPDARKSGPSIAACGFAILVASVLLVRTNVADAAEKPVRPNIVLLMADDQGDMTPC